MHARHVATALKLISGVNGRLDLSEFYEEIYIYLPGVGTIGKLSLPSALTACTAKK